MPQVPGFARRGAGQPRGRPRLPARGWRVHAGRHRHVGRVQAARTRSTPFACARTRTSSTCTTTSRSRSLTAAPGYPRPRASLAGEYLRVCSGTALGGRVGAVASLARCAAHDLLLASFTSFFWSALVRAVAPARIQVTLKANFFDRGNDERAVRAVRGSAERPTPATSSRASCDQHVDARADPRPRRGRC